MAGNPYYVAPMGGLDLGGAIDKYAMTRTLRGQEDEAAAVRQQAADMFAANDHQGLRSLGAQYPQLLKGYTDSIQWSSEQSKPVYTGWLSALSQAQTPEEAQQITQQAIASLEAVGAPTDRIRSDFARMSQLTPEEWQAESLTALQMADPDRYDKVTAEPDVPESIRELEAWQKLPDSPAKRGMGIEKGFITEGGEGLPPRLVAMYGPDAAEANAAFTAAGGGKDGLKAAADAVEQSKQARLRTNVPQTLDERFPNVTPEERAQLEQAVADAETVEKGMKAAGAVREEQRNDAKGRQYVSRARDVLTRVLSNPELTDVLGSYEGQDDIIVPRSDAEAEAIADIQEVQSILTSENMDLMTGVLSESDIKLLRELSSGALTRTRRSETFMRDARRLLEALSREIGAPVPPTPGAPSGASRSAGFRGAPPAPPPQQVGRFIIKQVGP